MRHPSPRRLQQPGCGINARIEEPKNGVQVRAGWVRQRTVIESGTERNVHFFGP